MNVSTSELLNELVRRLEEDVDPETNLPTWADEYLGRRQPAAQMRLMAG